MRGPRYCRGRRARAADRQFAAGRTLPAAHYLQRGRAGRIRAMMAQLAVMPERPGAMPAPTGAICFISGTERNSWNNETAGAYR